MVEEMCFPLLMNSAFAIVRFEHLSLSCAQPEFAQCRSFLSTFNGRAVCIAFLTGQVSYHFFHPINQA